MIIVFWMLLIVMISLSAALAEDYGPITPANMGKAYQLYNQGRRSVWISGRTPKPARIVVNRPMAQTTAKKQRLFEVLIAGGGTRSSTIYLDPKGNYRRQGEYPIDENNHLLAAQRHIRSMIAKPARIVRNPNAGKATHRAVIHPQMILLKPGMLLRPNPNQPRLKKIEIPMVPAPPKKKDRLMAMASPSGS